MSVNEAARRDGRRGARRARLVAVAGRRQRGGRRQRHRASAGGRPVPVPWPCPRAASRCRPAPPARRRASRRCACRSQPRASTACRSDSMRPHSVGTQFGVLKICLAPPASGSRPTPVRWPMPPPRTARSPPSSPAPPTACGSATPRRWPRTAARCRSWSCRTTAPRSRSGPGMIVTISGRRPHGGWASSSTTDHDRAPDAALVPGFDPVAITTSVGRRSGGSFGSFRHLPGDRRARLRHCVTRAASSRDGAGACGHRRLRARPAADTTDEPPRRGCASSLLAPLSAGFGVGAVRAAPLARRAGARSAERPAADRLSRSAPPPRGRCRR